MKLRIDPLEARMPKSGFEICRSVLAEIVRVEAVATAGSICLAEVGSSTNARVIDLEPHLSFVVEHHSAKKLRTTSDKNREATGSQPHRSVHARHIDLVFHLDEVGISEWEDTKRKKMVLSSLLKVKWLIMVYLKT
jgi:hypothetical protein